MMSNRDHSFQKTIKTDVINGNINLLRVGVIFLAFVSFFTTANGMGNYIFTEDSVIAYAASAAIQGILLALSMNLPGYLRGIWKRTWSLFLKLLLCFLALFLTAVIIFCSSWFSYVYIVDVIHKESWAAESELLVQQTYRSELYDVQDYISSYRIYLEESVGEKILLLDEQAGKLSDSNIDFEMDWNAERINYLSGETTAAAYMANVIDAIEGALKENSSQEDRDLAVTAVADAKNNISNRRETIQQNLNTINANITNYNIQIEEFTNRINSAQSGTDTDELTASINNYTRLINDATRRQTVLQEEDAQLDNALLRLSFYESLLGLTSSTSAISIRSELMQMQSEFFQQDPDEKKLLEIATEIFDNLRSASRLASDDGEGMLSDGKKNSYTSLLMQMNRLIQNLMDYSEIKDIELNLDNLVAELREINLVDVSDSTGIVNNNEQWKREWRERLEILKAQIGSVPVYSESDVVKDTENSLLSEFQINILNSYNRNKSSRELDDMIRRYISNHSPIYQGLIYLQSPYWGLSVFALFLAISFDLSGFVFGIVIEGNPQRKKSNITPTDNIVLPSEVSENSQTEWSILKTMNQYMVLTGDYENRDGIYYYKVFNNGLLYQWPVQDVDSYVQGIYIQDKIVPTKGNLISGSEQEILFDNQPGGPVDGIYVDCQLIFNEGGLILNQKDQLHFIASINEYVPVHSYNPDKGENQTIPAKQLANKGIKSKLAVVALNEKGTRVSAVYMIEH